MKNSDKYLKAIKENICSICVDSSEEGECILTEKEICAVEIYLPKIVELIHGSQTDNIFDLHLELRDKICSDCKTSKNKEHCHLRDDSNCALDRYFSIIVDTIQKVDLQVN
ncbi:MAG: hypothetical protein CVV23_02670 [Ignavibacteriae bacterium HGW-Ignavibacteriae-2]|jgi:hypothetical protein|nr:hypothetical protein [Bacteroidota bacterium]PKL89954.1 MAG: hypothetical protein CVV23_02670 [Ignavibacteriae bacterium HGW-Ignavibacteriae-2]